MTAYEATTNLMLVETAGGMTEADLWCFAAGLMCMFQRFYGASSATIDETPSGTHPHPAVRMRMAMNKIKRLFAVPDFARVAGWSKGPDHTRAVMDHAVYTANVYWHLRHLGLEARPPFLDAVVTPQIVPKAYQETIFGVWKSMRPEIVEGHLGDAEALGWGRVFLATGARARRLEVPGADPDGVMAWAPLPLPS